MEYASTLARIAEVSAQTSSDHGALESIVEEAASLFSTDMGAIFHLGQNGSVKHVASVGLSPRSIRRLEVVSSANHIAALLDTSSRPVIFQHAKKKAEEIGAWANLLDATTIALAPLQCEGAKLG